MSTLNLEANSDNFIFDNEMLCQIHFSGYRIGEVSCPTKYFPEASSISFRKSVVYGIGVLLNSLKFRIQKLGFYSFSIFKCLNSGEKNENEKKQEKEKE